MNIFKKALDAGKTFKLWDWSIFKICLISFGLLLGSLIPALIEKVQWWVYLIIFVVTDIYLVVKIFKKKK